MNELENVNMFVGKVKRLHADTMQPQGYNAQRVIGNLTATLAILSSKFPEVAKYLAENAPNT